MVQIRQLSLGPLQTNCYLLCSEKTQQTAVIDPSWEGKAIFEVAEQDGWEISHILLTHTHFDHVGGLWDIKQATKAPIFVHPDAEEMLSKATMSAAFFGIKMLAPPPPDEYLHPGMKIKVGDLSIDVLYTPGHAPGHVSFYLPEFHILFDGDVLFKGGIGRTDFEGGDYDTLMNTIESQFLTLPDDTRVFSGHGSATTIGEERSNNPFLQDF